MQWWHWVSLCLTVLFLAFGLLEISTLQPCFRWLLSYVSILSIEKVMFKAATFRLYIIIILIMTYPLWYAPWRDVYCFMSLHISWPFVALWRICCIAQSPQNASGSLHVWQKLVASVWMFPERQGSHNGCCWLWSPSLWS